MKLLFSLLLTLWVVLSSASALMGPFDKDFGGLKRFRIDPLADGSFQRESEYTI